MKIIAIIEGKDPQLKNECIVIGAFSSNKDAKSEILKASLNDNTFPISSVIELADIYSKNYIKPKRSIIFAIFSQKEQWQLGSDLFVNYLPKSIDKIIAFFNIDNVEFSKSIEKDHGHGASKVWYLSKKNNFNYTKTIVEPTFCDNKCNLAYNYKENAKNILYFNFASISNYENLYSLSDTYDAHNIICFKKISQLAFLFSLQLVNAYFSKDIMLQ